MALTPGLNLFCCRVASAKFGFVRACEDANFQRTHSKICEGNHTYFLLEGIKAAFMRAFVRALLLRVAEASLALGFVPPPVFCVRTARR